MSAPLHILSLLAIGGSSSAGWPRGLFAGVSLEGSTLRQDSNSDEKIYGRKISARDIVREQAVGVPAAGREMEALLDKYSPRNRSERKSLGQ